jgi:hypothetical protein
MEQLGSNWMDFYEIRCLNVFRKSVEKIQVWLKYDKNNGCVLYMETNVYFFYHISLSFHRMRISSDKFIEKKRTFYLQYVSFFKSRAVYEIIWWNVVEPGRPQMTIWRMRIACCISETTKTLSKYVILLAFPLQQRLHERAWNWCYTYIASLLKFYFSFLYILNVDWSIC